MQTHDGFDEILELITVINEEVHHTNGGSPGTDVEA